ncbi:MAG TPA: type II TA system antitoxin MqsA family protein [Chitinophagaceae bacterium]|nr:type II TA system antitoxin MqsA family protein [Chitinophagaceae bacterium]
MKQRIECPYCDGIAVLSKEVKEVSYRRDNFRIIAHYYKCEKCSEEFTTTEADAIGLTQVYNQYREKYNILFPEEIITIRQQYELSAVKMSEVLGLGANGYSNYENGEIPTPALAKLIATAAKPSIFMDFLMKAKNLFSPNSFDKAKQRVELLIKEEESPRPFYSLLNIYTEPNNYTGYKKIDTPKISSLIVMFIKKCKAEFNDRLKLNKLLFFTDFCHYKNYGKSISGLSYRAIQYGPVPACYDNIYTYLENEQIITSEWIRLQNGSAREIFKPGAEAEANLFSKEELETIDAILQHFRETSTWDIVDLSHKEKAWKELEANKSIIGYQDYAFDLVGA